MLSKVLWYVSEIGSHIYTCSFKLYHSELVHKSCHYVMIPHSDLLCLLSFGYLRLNREKM